MESVQETIRAVTSKPVQRAVVNSALLASGALALFGVASIASALFFQSFLPHKVVTTPVHLQYGSSLNPFGLVPLTARPMKTQQDYDISVTLSLPRSPANVERGNFMVTLYLLDKDMQSLNVKNTGKIAGDGIEIDDASVLFNSRRPALVPYEDPIVSIGSRVLFMLYHILFPSTQACQMTIPLAERVRFPQGSQVPSTAYLEIEGGQAIQTYHAILTLTAQLSGLRYYMVHYRLIMYMAFTVGFWICEVVFMGIAWGVWASMAGPRPEVTRRKELGARAETLNGEYDEEDEEGEGEGLESSDIPHTFPTYGKQPALKHEPRVKAELEMERPLSEYPVGGAEADDEEDEDELDEDAAVESLKRDSGIGTSYSEEGGSSIRRRSSRK
ncbi:putative adipose-regulatory protein-domain-containing protein [Stachybotrys elegans]|uniref:Adipose-regulatory protein-domain-containing protein n=1 Tax=Stachybotrys elegans TaxID=80388 RepID=A0A8K0WSC9_9HYPO|nr:putative adipose-regulatory protein-domain-containing protein [Stachybotrys elegans]